MSNILRSMARTKAKARMKKKGLTKICKGSFFRENWRKWAK